MKEGLEEFLKRIEAKPTNETLIDRFVTLVLEEDVLERILYLKKLVGLLLTPNPYAALKAAALELQEARKEKLTKEYEIGALKDVESCFLKLEKMENAALVRDEINKLQSDVARENTVTRGRTPPPNLPQAEEEDEPAPDVPLPVRQARVHFRLPSPELDDEAQDDERTQQHKPSEADSIPPSPPRPAQKSVPPTAQPASGDAQYSADMFGYAPKRSKTPAADPANSFTGPKEFYDKSLEETDDQPEETTRRSSLSKVSGLKVGPNLLENPEDRDPPRPRNIQSVFESTDVFAQNSSANPGKDPQPSEKSNRGSKEAPAKPRSRAALDPSEYAPDSNAMFQESQQVHFPESSSQRSMSRQETRKPFSYDLANSAVAPSPLENTEILPESNLMSAPIPYDDEATTQLDPEELLKAQMPVEPAFPPRDFDIPPYEFVSPREAKAAAASKNKAKDPFAGVRDQAPPKREAPARSSEPDAFARSPERDASARSSERDAFARAPERDAPARATERDAFARAPEPDRSSERDAFARATERDAFAPARPTERDVPARSSERDAFAPARPPDPIPDVFAPAKAANPAPARDPFAKGRESLDPFAVVRDPAPPSQAARDPFSGMREAPVREPIPFPKEMAEPRSVPVTPTPAIPMPTPAPAPSQAKAGAQPSEPRWNLLRDRLRLLSGLQISRSHASDFVLRLLGEHSSRDEQQEVLSILMRVLEGPRQAAAEQRFLAFLFEELQPKALHQLLGALKIGDQTVVFFADYLQSLLKERQLRRMLNVIHAVIVPGLDLSWYQESYRFLMVIWPELGLKGWHWLEEEGPMVFCERLAEREDLLPATLLA
ncbi:MAG TPA: hypothetical protein VFO10_00475 [Oligoflexus sp.]|uniref:hypothetical protein n=1 Tax=Oligoflexus sp. TaxID=1971216 RepID=UPI002D7F1C84|nr:hypothetical protein [Oligoflexus sp.]HET9235690.1 hypothetical protein [Oligoflexus sp.]